MLYRTWIVGALAVFAAVAVAAQTNSSSIDSDGAAHITRVIPLPPSLSPEARKWLSRQIPDTDRKLSVDVLRAVGDGLQVQATTEAQSLYATKVAADSIAGVPVKVVTPPTVPAAKRNRVLMCLHGGAFVADFGSASESIPIASLTQTKVISVLYRFAPEHPFPAALDDAFAVYRELLKTHRPKDIGIYGTSSGAALTAELAVRLKREHVPLPAALGVFSGWGDFSRLTDSAAMYGPFGLSGPAGVDCSSCSVAAYIGSAATNDPALSPLFADLRGLPATLFLTGTRDLTLSGTVILHRAFREARVPAELIVFEGLPHAFWSTAPQTMPEAIEANRIIAEFFDRHLGVRKGGGN